MVARSPPWVIIDVEYPKRIFHAAVCDSNLWVPVTPRIKHRPINGSCDLDGNGFVSGISSCRNKWHFEKGATNASRPKVDACVIEAGNC